MNKIAVQTLGITERFGMNEGYRKIREWSFDGADANIHTVLSKGQILRRDIPEVLVRGGSDCMALFRPWGEAARAAGVENLQAHAPFPSWLPFCGKTNGKLIEVLKNAIRACDLIGCRKLVIHPFYAGPSFALLAEIEERRNLDNYAKLVPVAKEYGITICLENMIAQGLTKRLRPGACGEPETALRYVDALNRFAGQELFGFCFDTGHAHACGIDIKQALVTLGARVVALHIHDNDGLSDQHLIPRMGSIDWDSFTEGLRAIHYTGAISFETFGVFSKLLPEQMDETMRSLSQCGRMFAQKIAENPD